MHNHTYTHMIFTSLKVGHAQSSTHTHTFSSLRVMHDLAHVHTHTHTHTMIFTSPRVSYANIPGVLT